MNDETSIKGEKQTPMLCVGGCEDGRWRIGNGLYFRTKTGVSIAATNLGTSQQIVVDEMHTYIQECLPFTDEGNVERIHFWRHDKISMREAVSRIFAGYKGTHSNG